MNLGRLSPDVLDTIFSKVPPECYGKLRLVCPSWCLVMDTIVVRSLSISRLWSWRVPELRRFKNLQELVIHNASDETVAALREITTLTSLDLFDPNITASGFRSLNELRLTSLSIWQDETFYGRFQYMSAMSYESLRKLSLSMLRMNDLIDIVQHLSTTLVHLHFEVKEISDVIWEKLNHLTRLESLHVGCTNEGEEEEEVLRTPSIRRPALVLPYLRDLSLVCVGNAFPNLRRLYTLEKLHVTDPKQTFGMTTSNFVQLPPIDHMKCLKTLIVENVTLSVDTVQRWHELVALENLRLQGCYEVSEEILDHLIRVPNLKRFLHVNIRTYDEDKYDVVMKFGLACFRFYLMVDEWTDTKMITRRDETRFTSMEVRKIMEMMEELKTSI